MNLEETLIEESIRNCAGENCPCEDRRCQPARTWIRVHELWVHNETLKRSGIKDTWQAIFSPSQLRSRLRKRTLAISGNLRKIEKQPSVVQFESF